MKGLLTISLVLSFAAATSLGAQSLDQLSVRESITDMNGIENPAEAQTVFTHGKRDGSAVNAGVKWNLIDPKSDDFKTLSIGPTVELHRNFSTPQPQATFLAGANLNWRYDSSPRLAQRFLLSVEYKKDKIQQTESSQVTFRYALVAKRLRMGDLAGPEWMGFQWQPTVGFEFEDVARTANGNPTGRVQRSYAAAEATLYPAHVALASRLVWTGSFAYWINMFQTSGLNQLSDHHQLLKTSLAVFVDRSHHVGVSIDYVRGENPAKGQLFENYGAASFRVQF